MALTHRSDSGTGARSLRSLAGDERGQVLPFLLLVIIALLAAGMLVLWVGLSSSIATDAQTAADASALAAEQSVDTQWNTLINVDGVLEPRDSYDPGVVEQAAQSWASRNDGTVTSVEYCSDSGSCSSAAVYTAEPDVLITVRSNQTLPKNSDSPGSPATAQARASVNPNAQASPSVTPSTTTSTCSPNALPGPNQFSSHGGQAGFFAAPDTKFDPGYPCENSLAARLDALGKSLNLHIVGVWGAGTNDPAGQGDLTAGGQAELVAGHTCGAVAQVQGLSSSVTATELAQYGLVRYPGQSDEIEFANPSARCTTNTSAPASSSQPVSVGNGKVHLVPLTGGPQGTAVIGIGAIPGTGPWPAIASYLPIYQMIAKQYGWNQAQLQDWLGVEQIEDSGGDLGIASDKAFGLAQFQTVNYCHYGPGSCPQDNPSAEQELESMALYIHDVYGDPAAALAHELSHDPHWY